MTMEELNWRATKYGELGFFIPIAINLETQRVRYLYLDYATSKYTISGEINILSYLQNIKDKIEIIL